MTAEIKEKLEGIREKEKVVVSEVLYKFRNKYKEHIHSTDAFFSGMLNHHIWIETVKPYRMNLLRFSPIKGCDRKNIHLILDHPDFEMTRTVYEGIFIEIVEEINKKTILYRFMYKQTLDSVPKDNI